MSKNIVICYDGTANEFGEQNTNVVRLFKLLGKSDKQSVFYDPGVGTFSPLGWEVPKVIGKTLGNAFGVGLQRNVEDGYRFLMNTYEVGDKVYLCGFSRGAFTARALNGMICEFGLLHKYADNLLPYVSAYYNGGKFSYSSSFKNVFSRPCDVHCMGVFDTVASLGYIMGKNFFDATLGHNVDFAYQAMAIDEHRKKFPVSLWNESNKAPHQHIEQVWFAGSHGDVGGCYEEREASDIALAWLVDKMVGCGLLIDENWREMLKCGVKGKLHNSREGAWRVWRSVDRVIGQGALVHQSVVDRMGVSDYAPKNLEGVSYEVVSNASYEANKEGISVD